MKMLKNRLGAPLIMLILALAMTWPAIVNRQAFLFADTTNYIKGAATGAQHFFSVPSEWLEQRQTQGYIDSEAAQNESSPEKKGVLAGRSVYYGAFILMSSALGGFWGTAFAQALLSMMLIASVIKEVGIDTTGVPGGLSTRLSVCGLLLLVGTSLPFFSSFLMPDLFAGLGILAMGAFVALPKASRWRQAFWLALCTTAVLFHSANILILGWLLAVAIIVMLSRGERVTATTILRICALAVALIVGVLGEMAFDLAVQKITGTAPIRPPFLTARLVADGPGAQWARHHCPDAGLEICKYVSRLGVGTSDDFLWSTDPLRGVFTLADKASRVSLSHEQTQFAGLVTIEYPGEVLGDLLRNIVQQLKMMGLEEFECSDDGLQFMSSRLPQNYFLALENSLSCSGRFPLRVFELIQVALIAGSSLIILTIWLSNLRRQISPRVWYMTSAVLVGLLINAIICGGLSTPHDRYQTRVSWLIPLLAAILLMSRRKTAQAIGKFSVDRG